MQLPTIPESLANQVDPVVHFIASRLDAFGSDIQEIKGVQKEMAANFTKLIVIEERQATTMAGLERAFKAVEKLDTKLEAYTSANRETCQGAGEGKRRPGQARCGVGEKRADAGADQQVGFGRSLGSLALLAGFIVPRILDRMFS